MPFFVETCSKSARRISQVLRGGASEPSPRKVAKSGVEGEGEGEDDATWPDFRLVFRSPPTTLQTDPTAFESYLPLPPAFSHSRRVSARSPYTWSTASTSSTATGTLPLEPRPHSIAVEALSSLPSSQPLQRPRPVSAPSGTLPPLYKSFWPQSPPPRQALLSPPPSPVKELALAPCELGTAFAAFLEDIAYGEKAARQASLRPTSRRIRDVDSLNSKRTSRSRSMYLPSRKWSRWSEETEVDSEEEEEEEESDEVSMLCATAAMLEGRWMVSPGF